MKLIDEKGKLFGLINVVDLIVLLLVIVVAAGAYSRFTPETSSAGQGELQEIEVKVMLPEVMEFAANSFSVGDELINANNSAYFGQIKDIVIQPISQKVIDEEGQVVLDKSNQRYNATLTVAVQGQVSPTGVVKMDNYQLLIGEVLFVQSNVSKGRVVITEINI